MHWFPEKEHQRFTRCAESVAYLEEFSKLARLYNSPIFAMHRILNNNPTPLDPGDLTNLFQ